MKRKSVIKPLMSSSSSSQPEETSRQPSSSSLQAEKTPSPSSSSSLPAEKPPIKNVIPRHLQRPTPKDMTPEEWRKLHEYSEKLRKLPRGQWELEDLLWTCPEYHQGFISKEEGLKKMEGLRKYYKQLYDSEGFDCDYKPELGLPPGHIYKQNCTKRFLGTYFKDLAAKALQSYNNKCKPRKFEVLGVKNVNATEDVYRTYYLTFTAKDVSSCYGSTRVFQACIFTPWTYENKKNLKPKIHLCRMKPRSVCSMSLRDEP